MIIQIHRIMMHKTEQSKKKQKKMIDIMIEKFTFSII
jgi:hypothetical protein